MSKYLFFSPNTAVWIHTFPEALIADALRQGGHEICYVTCGGLFNDYCVSMSAYGVPFDATPAQKKIVCDTCNLNRNIIRRSFNFNGYNLIDSVTAKEVVQINGLLEEVNQRNYLEFKVDDFNLGRAALYEVILRNKKVGYEFTDEEWPQYISSLRNTLLSYFATRRILEQERPDAIVVFNPLYSVNSICKLLAEKNDIELYFLDAGMNFSRRLQTMAMGKGFSVQYSTKLVDRWKEFRDNPCDSVSARHVTDHFLQLFEGKGVLMYSKAKSKDAFNVRKYFGVFPEQKILLATLSSFDEIFSAQAIGVYPEFSKLLFPTQTEWIENLVAFVKERPDLFLIIRVHPREFPNKREGKKSPQVAILEQTLQVLPNNVRVNWPSDGISIYDLAEEVNVGLNMWSTAGKELAFLGIPVVVYIKDQVFYPTDLNLLGTTRETYFAAIDQALKQGWDFERIRKVYRWAALEYDYSVVDLSDGCKLKDFSKRSKLRRALEKVLRHMKPGLDREIDCIFRKRKLKDGSRIRSFFESDLSSPIDVPGWVLPTTISEQEETHILHKELKRVAKALYGGSREPVRPGTLREKFSTLLFS